MKKLLVLSVAMVCCGLFAGEALAQNGDWALARRGNVMRTSANYGNSQTQVVRYQTVDASGLPVETTVTSAPVYADPQPVQYQPVQYQPVQTFRTNSCCQCCQPVAYQQVQYANACNPSGTVMYSPMYSPVAEQGSSFGLLGGGRQVYVGRGILGQPKAYVEGQPVRNALRWMLP